MCYLERCRLTILKLVNSSVRDDFSLETVRGRLLDLERVGVT